MSPLLSVIVPAYGVAEYLPACLDSLLNQTLSDLEVIVIDDQSPDECGEIADSYALFDDRVRVLHTHNQGPGPARNTGVSVATGQFLAFADSDDLVPPRAYQLLVESLQKSGSDIAGGDVWRHIDGRGNVPSWTHRQAFSEHRMRTHIREYPLLIRDRMMWNKVYRRDFWLREDLTFPAMMYEDYPVALKAHLQAKSVDVLPEKVYIWRQREAETSITQRSLDLDNAIDRVTSAEMVLDLIDVEAFELSSAVHAYFIEVDLVTLATAIAMGLSGERAELTDLALRLANRLRPEHLGVPKIAQLIHKCLLSDNVDAAAALALWRQEGDKRRLLQAMATPRGALLLPSLVDAITRRRAGEGLLRDRKLKCKVVFIERNETAYELRIQMNLRGVFLARAKVKVELQTEAGAVELDVVFDEIEGRRGFMTIIVPDEKVLSLGEERLRLLVRCRVGSLTWQGGVSCARSEMPVAEQSAAGPFIIISHPISGPSEVWFRAVDAAAMAEPKFREDRLVVHVKGSHKYVAILRPQPTPPLVSRVRDGIATFLYEDVISDPADDPTNSRAYRAVVALVGESLTTATMQAVNATEMLTEATHVDPTQGLGPVERQRAEEAASLDAAITLNTPDDKQSHSEPDESELQSDIERAGVLELVWTGEEAPEASTCRGHMIGISRSRTGNAEIFHEVVDHFFV